MQRLLVNQGAHSDSTEVSDVAVLSRCSMSTLRTWKTMNSATMLNDVSVRGIRRLEQI